MDQGFRIYKQLGGVLVRSVECCSSENSSPGRGEEGDSSAKQCNRCAMSVGKATPLATAGRIPAMHPSTGDQRLLVCTEHARQARHLNELFFGAGHPRRHGSSFNPSAASLQLEARAAYRIRPCTALLVARTVLFVAMRAPCPLALQWRGRELSGHAGRQQQRLTTILFELVPATSCQDLRI